MSAAASTQPVPADPNWAGHSNESTRTGSGAGGPASKRITVDFGFWIFLLSDIVMFSAFFAAYAVLSGATAGGPKGRDLFDLSNVGIETGLLLASSFTCGLATIAADARNRLITQTALLVTGLLGAGFLVLEAQEFTGLVAQDAGPMRSAFLSAFFALVGLHGVHVTVGLLWLGTMMAQLLAKGFTEAIGRCLLCFTLLWHALDIIWVALITNVYLMGMI